jgi:hypothetical protein
MATTETIKDAVDAAAERAAVAEEYSTADGTRVKRAKLSELLAVRRDLDQQGKIEARGMFRPAQMGRPQ